MRLSQAFIPTLKETPSDAVIPSHALMVRAGLVRQLAAGIYDELPFGWRAMQKAMEIVRQEMNRIGGQELFLPALNPLEIWEETGRAKGFGDEMFRLKDRKGRPMCLAPTHEEIICDLARAFLRSYRDLPQIWYQIQTKMRDEPRPRSGILRARQFLMKDSYSLDSDHEGLDRSYALHDQAYRRIFERCGLQFVVVGASSGLMGGTRSEEFMVESPHGEDHLAVCSACEYAANLEVAASRPAPVQDVPAADPGAPPQDVSTPDRRTIEEVSGFLGVAPERLVKTLVFMTEEDKPVMALVAGDDELNEAKLMSALGGAFRPAHPDEVKDLFGAEVGFLGPVGAPKMPVYADLRLQGGINRITGANKNHYHLTGVNVGRDFAVDHWTDLRTAREGEGCPACNGTLRVVNAIEIGHIFKLGTKYSEAMGANVLDPQGRERPIVMGSYGIGIGRIVACAIELGHDDKGIIWPPPLTPYDVMLIGLNMKDAAIRAQAEAIYADLQAAGLEVLFDDRDVSPGFKFNDADLLGLPWQVVVSPKNLAGGNLEVKDRATGQRTMVPLGDIVNHLKRS
ncbi:MAG: proline--tRNA ligase [Candidatus Zixiibacteriota bacterium]|nr:MAG: proline--tRNA ligase [candidate division Zixibacteria bacterium]